jgi:hypothetical protein
MLMPSTDNINENPPYVTAPGDEIDVATHQHRPDAPPECRDFSHTARCCPLIDAEGRVRLGTQFAAHQAR